MLINWRPSAVNGRHAGYDGNEGFLSAPERIGQQVREQGETMHTSQSATTDAPDRVSAANSKALIVGFSLVAAGGLIGLAGAGISGVALATAARRWMQAQDEPPSAVMRRKLSQAKAATTAATAAGTKAWQNGLTPASSR